MQFLGYILTCCLLFFFNMNYVYYRAELDQLLMQASTGEGGARAWDEVKV